MSALERLPACATTGVGSLPFTDPGVAAEHVWHAYDLPFCPQLPALDGDMITEWLGADPRRCGWSRERDRERPHAWDAFLRAAANGPRPAHGLVKLQVTGPLTLAHALDPAAGPDLAGEIATWLAANAAAQTRALAERGLSVVLVVDEPWLEAVAPAPVHADVSWLPLRLTGAVAWGLHVCCEVPWPVVELAAPDVLSVDLTRPRTLDGAGASALARHVRAGRRVAWGAIGVDAHRQAAHAASDGVVCLAMAVSALERRGLGADEVMAASLLTAACGTGRSTAVHERALASALSAMAGAGRGWQRARVPAS